ncbi:FirrV-1-B2 [Feldmannia irregularis virus a]|uniref:FirrV-1-B2 n=1 Tax=Feldmannia irregularis virus a TaxID=231992 RepID=Q6XM34_9PHYC|nr:FirrV-1-B2 [Feldmannia irregularis virus a]AAR26877.1 FirrV-1-B2 [Feldmannia irregularis virus a]
MTDQLKFEDCVPCMPLEDGEKAYVCKVYDGDTCTLAWIDHKGRKVRISCRIRDIDTPEMRSKATEERTRAVQAKEKLADVVLYREVTVKNPGKDKYGRLLADIATDKLESVAEYMLTFTDLCKPFVKRKTQKNQINIHT